MCFVAHTHTHTHAADFLSLHSSFPGTAGTGGSRTGADPIPDRAYQALQKQQFQPTAEALSNQRHKPGCCRRSRTELGGTLLHQQGGDVTCSHKARDELLTSRCWAHLAPGGTGQQEGGCSWPAPDARDSGQQLCAQSRGQENQNSSTSFLEEQQPPALLGGTARTMQMASVTPRNPLVPSLHVSSTTSPSLPPSKDASQTPGSAFPQGFWAAPLGAQGLPWSALAGTTAAMRGAGSFCPPLTISRKVRTFPFISSENK